MSPLSTILICSTVFLLFLSSTPMHVHLHFHVSAKLPTPKPRSAMAMGALLNKPPTPKFISALINRKAIDSTILKSNQNLVKIADFMKKQQARDLLKHLLAQGYKPVITRVEEGKDHRANKVKHLCSTKKCTSFLDGSLERGNSI